MGGWFLAMCGAGKFQSVRVARNHDCPVCVRGEFAHLDGEAQPHITMCGRDSVQIHERGRASGSGRAETAAGSQRWMMCGRTIFCCGFAWRRMR